MGQVPLDIRKTLNLPKDAKGIDGVIRTRTDELVLLKSNIALVGRRCVSRKCLLFLD